MEELAAGQKPGGAEERAPCLPISLTVPSLSLPVCLPVSGPAIPTRFFILFLMHVVPFPSALTPLSHCCLSAFPMPPAPCMAGVAAVAAKTLCGPSILSLEYQQREGGIKGDE